jgi:hypothetical protein
MRLGATMSAEHADCRVSLFRSAVSNDTFQMGMPLSSMTHDSVMQSFALVCTVQQGLWV